MLSVHSPVLTPPLATDALTPMKACGGALVTGADYRGLGIVRSLGRRGIPVWVLRDDEHSLASVSRFSRHCLRWPSSNEVAQLEYLLNLAVRCGLQGWMLFPTDDQTVALVARHHDLLAKHYRLTTSSWDKLSHLCDKRSLHAIADRLGLDQPWTFCPRNRDELATLDGPFPMIIKPAMRVDPNRLSYEKAWRVDDRASLLRRYDEALALVPPEMLMIQEVIPGGGEAQFSCGALCHDGQPLALLAARRIRQFPRDFGRFSTYVESIDEPAVVAPAVRLLRAVGFSGIVEIEFKRDPRDGRYKLLDANPRVWGWHTLSRGAGIDVPYLAWRHFNGETLSEIHGRAGKRWMRLSVDMLVAAQEMFAGRLSPRCYLQSLRSPLELAVFEWDDALPALAGMTMLIRAFWKRVLRLRGFTTADTRKPTPSISRHLRVSAAPDNITVRLHDGSLIPPPRL